MALTDFTIIRRSMTTRLFSSVVTVLSVAVAVGLLLTLLSMRDASRQAFQRGSGNMHLLVSGDSSPMVAVLNGVFYANAPSRALTMARCKQLADDPRVAWAVPTQLGDSYQGLPVLATVPEFFASFQPEDSRPWRFTRGGAFSADYQVVVGARAASIARLKLDDIITLTHGTGQSRAGGGEVAPPAHVHEQFRFRVVGVLEPTGTIHDRALFVSLGSSWAMHAFDRQEREEAAARGGGPRSRSS